jgi:hypothetical protein
MDSTIIGAIIGALGTLAAALVIWALPARKVRNSSKSTVIAFAPDQAVAAILLSCLAVAG